MKFAVIGKDVSKSISPQIHLFIAGKLNKSVEYDKISVPEEEFERTIDGLIKAYDGLNITIPYKLSVMTHLKTITGDAAAFGAVNTVKCKDLSGNNTDGLGFMLMLKNNGIKIKGKKFLVIGAGGAGRSVAKKLSDGGAEVYIYDKNIKNAKTVENEFKGVKALENLELTPYYAAINASGVGMHKTEGLSPAGAELLKNCEAAIDLIYVPIESEFLRIANSLGKKTVNGLAMLFYQAYYAQCIWFGLKPDEEQAKDFFTEFTMERI
ncbi:MAG: shikimate dehydrogenase [Clostridia bacterium]|nr:shikimate dehydrogenase [Clostridia bacterium]